MRVLVDEIAQSRRRTARYRTFDPSDADFAARLRAALHEATEQRVLPILIVAREAAARSEWRAAIVSLLGAEWRGGIVIPVEASDAGLAETIRREFEVTPNQREWIVVKIAQGGIAQFRTAIISVADDILARIVRHGSVVRATPATAGPSVRPRIANTHDAPQAQP